LTVRWLIESDVFPETAARVTAALDAQGMPWTRFHEDLRAIPDGDLIFWGSLGVAYGDPRVARAAIGEIDRFRCSAYFPELDSLLANRDATFTTVRELVDGKARPGLPARVFVRPDSALKPFAGRVVTTAELSLPALDHGFYYDDERLPILVAPARAIGREWRFIVGDGAIIAGCEYGAERAGRGEDIPAAARAVAQAVASHPWQAARLYIADVAEVDGAPAIVELNPFSGADLYHCDPDAIVRFVSRAFG
jgi:hypothetical protein